MTPSPTSSNVTGQSNDGTKKEEKTEDLKETQQGNVFGHIQVYICSSWPIVVIADYFIRITK